MVGFTGCCAVRLWNGHSENHEVELGWDGVVVALPSTPGVLDLTSFPVTCS